MRKTTISSIVNLLLVAVIWAGIVGLAYQVFEMRAIWQLLVIIVVALPVAGYFVQYLISPIVNRLIGGKLPTAKSDDRP